MLCTQVVYVTLTLDLDSPLHRRRSHVLRKKIAQKEQTNRAPDLATRNSITISMRLQCQPGVAGWRTTCVIRYVASSVAGTSTWEGHLQITVRPIECA